MNSCPYRIVLVDDHVVVRDGLEAILHHLANGEFVVVGEAESGTDAVQLSLDLKPDIVLMDISMPGLNGIEATAEILARDSRIKIVACSMLDDEFTVMNAMKAGARGFVPKRASPTDMLDCLRVVATGGSYLSPQVSARLLELVRQIQRGEQPRKPPSPLLEGLSRRELQVLRLVAEGKTIREIADILDLEIETIRTWRKTMMRKLRVTNTAGAIKIAMSAGLIGVSSPYYFGEDA